MSDQPFITAVRRKGEEERKYRAPALEKGLDVLELLARSGDPLTTSQIAASLGRSVSELFRMILALEYRGYIVPVEGTGEGYTLSNQLFTLGISRAPTKTLIDVAMPVMNALAHDIGQSCHLSILSGEQVVVVGRIESPGDLGFSVRVGYRRPVECSASGLAIFSFQSEKNPLSLQARCGFKASEWKDFTQRAREARALGYVRAPSEFTDGITDLSVPVQGARGAIAALTVPFVRSRPDNGCSVEEAAGRLCEAAAELAKHLEPYNL
ncbi:IclR family transcriptional regulator [Marinimicrobium sp. ARAG 43.8]|uniref:IclR family transcriptional regulator n=1 Tax=Marinimicrobium sp. ARAG 43.8 TaxID=3418719 RepID=UPI003CF819B6